ncbi:MAG: DUF4250 domain-containing protein [Lachnospiraceae bacterium]
MSMLPKDPVILLSYVNTQLRDFYPTLDEFCAAKACTKSNIVSALATIDYAYDPSQNQFV